MFIGTPVWCGNSTLKGGIKKAIDFGFDYVETSLDFPWPDSLPKHEISETLALAKKAGLEFGFHAPFAGIHLAHPRKKIQKAGIAVIKNCIDFANKFDGNYVNVHVNLDPPTTMELEQVMETSLLHSIESAIELGDYTKKHGMTLTIENMASMPFGFSDTLSQLMQKNVNFCLDVGHVAKLNYALMIDNASDLDVFGWINKFSKKIRVCHLHNFKHGHDHMTLDKGQLNIKQITSKLKKTKAKFMLLETVFEAEGTLITDKTRKKELKFMRRLIR